MASTSHQYPGVNLPLRHLEQQNRAGGDFYRCGSFEGATGSLSDLIQVREVAMMLLMDRLTDKPNWHEKVFDDAIVAKWRNEALTQNEEAIYQEIVAGKPIPMPKRTRLMNEAAFDFCIAELRCKAAHFKKTGLVFTLNLSQANVYGPTYLNTAIKADSLVGIDLQHGLKDAFEKLRADQAAEPDWHPGSDDMVQDLVHPSMYPFVYGETRFIQEEVVGVADAVDKWSGKGEAVPPTSEAATFGNNGYHFGHVNRKYWSETYQWLPANLVFQDDGTVRFTSYINNLHPKKHSETYKLVEKLIDTAIPAWDCVLSGRTVTASGEDPERVAFPPGVGDENQDEVWEDFNPEVLAEHEAKEGPIDYDEGDLEDFLDNLEYNEEEEDKEKTDEEREKSKQEAKERMIQTLKWREIRDPELMEPLDFDPVTYKVKQTLRKRFKDTGLQVIVKMASIELTPEKPDFPAGGWHIEGQMNEHIVATALYYIDSENVTPSQLSFRMATSSDQEALQSQVGQDQYKVYEHIYGTNLGMNNGSHTVQTYGSVATPEGRLLAFPNVFQHRVSSFSLQDRTKPGHRRFIAMWLVDPLQRIISTANVPPQQFNWWAEAVFGTEAQAAAGEMPPELFQLLLEQGVDKAIKPSDELLKKMGGNRLPVEIMEMVRRQKAVPEGLMTVEEAKRHRLHLMKHRTAFIQANEGEWSGTYSFCEH